MDLSQYNLPPEVLAHIASLEKKADRLEREKKETEDYLKKTQIERDRNKAEVSRLTKLVDNLEKLNLEIKEVCLQIHPMLKTFLTRVYKDATGEPYIDLSSAEAARTVCEHYLRFAAANINMLTIFSRGNEKLGVAKADLNTAGNNVETVLRVLAEREKQLKEKCATENALIDLLSLLFKEQHADHPLSDAVNDAFDHVEEDPDTESQSSDSMDPEGTSDETQPDAEDDALDHDEQKSEHQADKEAAETVISTNKTTTRKAPGRQVNKSNLLKVKKEFRHTVLEALLGKEEANRCIFLGEQYVNVKDILDNLTNQLRDVETKFELYQTKARKVVSTITADTNLGVTPKCALGLRVISSFAYLMSYSLPQYRVELMLLKNGKFGNSTLCYALDLFCKWYVKPIFLELCRAFAQQDTVMMDETTYDCNEMQGRGPCKRDRKAKIKEFEKDWAELKVQADAGGYHEFPSLEEFVSAKISAQPINSTNYVWAMNDPGGKYALYFPLRSRSAESMNEVINKWLPCMKPKRLIVDAYSGYPTLMRMREWNDSKRQCCLAHLRRACAKAAGFDSFERAMTQGGKKNWEKAKKMLEESIMTNDGTAMAFVCLLILKKVFHAENNVRRKDGETDESYYDRINENRRKHAAGLMDKFDDIMQFLAQYHAVQGKTGVWKANHPNSKSAVEAMVVYYMNSRNAFRAFTEDPHLPLSTNEAERQIRPVALSRHASHYIQSEQMFENLCMLYSVFETAERCGIEDPAEWIRLAAMSKQTFIIEKRFEQDCVTDNNGKNPSTGYVDWNEAMETIGEKWDAKRWAPDNYAKNPVLWRMPGKPGGPGVPNGYDL